MFSTTFFNAFEKVEKGSLGSPCVQQPVELNLQFITLPILKLTVLSSLLILKLTVLSHGKGIIIVM